MEDPPCLHAPHLPRSHTLVPSAAQAMLRSPARRPYWIGVNTSMPLSVRPWSPPRHLNPDGRARGRGGGDHAGLKPPAEADLGGRLGEGGKRVSLQRRNKKDTEVNPFGLESVRSSEGIEFFLNHSFVKPLGKDRTAKVWSASGT